MTDQEYAKLAIPLLTHVFNGKKIQYRPKEAAGAWEDRIDNKAPFDFEHNEYRMKPNARVEWRLKVNDAINAFAAVCQRGGSVLEQVTTKNKINTLLNNIPEKD